MLEYPYTLLQLDNKTLLVSGTSDDQTNSSTLIHIALNGTVLSNYTYEGLQIYSMIQVKTNNLVVAGLTPGEPGESGGLGVIQMNAQGDVLWDWEYPCSEPGGESVTTLLPLSDGQCH